LGFLVKPGSHKHVSFSKKKRIFWRAGFFPSQSELFENFLNCSDWLDTNIFRQIWEKFRPN